MPKIFQWAEIKGGFCGSSLILGNGASIAVHSGFGYASLKGEAEAHGYITPEVASIFKSFKTDDFELILRRLWEAMLVNKALGLEPGKVETAYQEVRQALIATVRKVHITNDEAKKHFEPMYQFMKDFGMVFSLNYDLLVYWAMMASRKPLGNWFKDCFQEGGLFHEDWQKLIEPYDAEGCSLVFYPHGSLITYRRSADYMERKLNLKNCEEKNLLDVILAYWEQGNGVPLFVSEGSAEQKKKSITSSSYLSTVFHEALPKCGESLVIYGWAISKQDKHLLMQLCHSGLRRVAASVYGGSQEIAESMAKTLKGAGVHEVLFFDAQSPGCWIYPDTK